MSAALDRDAVRRLRLAHQMLVDSTLTDPTAVVSRLVAMQAQEYAMAKWAIGLRLVDGGSDADVEGAYEDGRILRLHCLRPTWHFVAAEEVRLVLQVTAKRVHQANAFMYRRLELDTTRLDRFVDFVGELLSGRNYLTRTEIRDALVAGWVEEKGFQMAYLLMYAELQGVVVSGPRRGNQFTYALLDERAAPTPERSDDEALVEFVRRYLTTRGPATIPDLTTWSGLTVAQAKRAVTLLGDEVTSANQDGRAYLLVEGASPPTGTRSFLMPDYDEYGMAYKDRSALTHPDHEYWAPPWNRFVVVDGVIAGAWQRTLGPDAVTVEVAMFDLPWDDSRVVGAAEEYARFLGRELDLRAASGEVRQLRSTGG
jgi:Winged helix DNA-binding domain